MNKYSFLLIHGLFGSGPDHWQSWLYNELKQRNFPVVYPTFSKFNTPKKDIWLDELSSAVQSLPEDHKKIIITHSLGGVLWQHFSALQNKKAADQVILVAPPSPKIVLTEAKSFFPVPLSEKNLSRSAEKTLFVHSTNDPYCSMNDASHYLNLNFPAVTLENMGHINTESGHGKWPWILDLCMSLTTQKPAYINENKKIFQA